jgi:hypothetical protein
VRRADSAEFDFTAAVSNLAMKTLFGGVTNFVDGMNASLARIKAAAES